jgi:hypothetical protein
VQAHPGIAEVAVVGVADAVRGRCRLHSRWSRIPHRWTAARRARACARK